MYNARRFHAFLIKTGLDGETSSLRHLLLLSCNDSSAPNSTCYARAVFDLLPSPDTYAYNKLIRAHSHTPSCAPHALSLFSRMRRAGLSPDHYTFPFVLKSCARLRIGLELHSLILKSGFGSFIYVQNSLICLCSSLGLVSHALKVFDEMSEKDLVSWSAMISCFVNNGFWTEALEVFQRMQILGNLNPDEVTMISVISAISNLGALELGKWVNGFIRRNNLSLTIPLGTALISMFSRCGGVEDAVNVFNEMSERNVATWTALINGLAVHGRSKESLRLFYEMKKSGIQPDHVTFRAVLVACSHGGLVDEGFRVFNSIKDEYDMEATLEHHGCMVDLLGRAGLLQKAFDYIENMVVEPNAVIWRTLLGSCVNHNRIDLAEKVKDKIHELDPDHDGDYVLLSNAYGGAKRWNEMANLRNSMSVKRIHKNPGYSLLNTDQTVHKFVSGDDFHPKSNEIKEFLSSTIENLRIEGYAPYTSNVLHDVEEEEKENSLSYHSEKLAVAFSLMNFRENKTIRVMKNLRICNDCHCFMKHVSKRFGVEIVVRDRNRFHHFNEGSCNCNDYW